MTDGSEKEKTGKNEESKEALSNNSIQINWRMFDTFNSLAEDNPKALIEEKSNALLSAMHDLHNALDRNGDGKLTLGGQIDFVEDVVRQGLTALKDACITRSGFEEGSFKHGDFEEIKKSNMWDFLGQKK